MSTNSNTNADVWIAGAVAAFTVDLLVYPLDTLKTRLQSRNYARLYVDPVTRAVNRQAMFRGLYQGIGSVIIATLPSSGAFFTTYEAVKSGLTRANAQFPSLSNSAPGSMGLLPIPVIHSLASSTAELVSCAILTPAEVIKQNAQMVNNGNGGPNVNATLQTLSRFRSNPLALWRGYSALAGRNLPFTALQFPMFERLRSKLREARRQQNTDRARGGVGDFASLRRGFVAANGKNGSPHGLSLVENGTITAISAGLAGSVAAVITTPIDVVKTRIMLSAVEDAGQGAKEASPLAQVAAKGPKNPTQLVNALGQTAKAATTGGHGAFAKRQSSFAIGKEILATEGMKGLWRGGALRGVWTMVGSGLYLGAYESVRVWLALRRGEEYGQEVVL